MTKDKQESVTTRFTAVDGFDADDTGSYALDRWVVKMPGTKDSARLQIEISIAIGEDERVRCREYPSLDLTSRLARNRQHCLMPPCPPKTIHSFIS